MKKPFFALNVILMLTAGALAIWPIFDRAVATKFLFEWSHYFILMLFFLWAFTFIRWLRSRAFNFKSFLGSHAPGLVLSFALCVVTFVSVPPSLRLSPDETDLLGISQSMTFDRRADSAHTGLWYYQEYHPTLRLLPLRPLLFPLFSHVLHVISGYRTYHPYVVNFIVLFALLSLLYVVVSRRLGKLWACAALILAVSQPLVTQCAASAGYDLLNAFFLFACIVQLRAFLSEPTEIQFQFFWMNLLMLANARREGFLLSLVFILALAACRRIRKEHLRTPLFYAVSFLSALPIVWQRLSLPHLPNVEYLKKGESLFSVSNFLENIRLFGESLFRFDYYLPYANLVNWLGIASVIYFTYEEWIKKPPAINAARRHWILISAGVLSTALAISTFITVGMFTYPNAYRYFLPFALLFSIPPVFLAHRIRWIRERPVVPLLVGLAMFLLYHPISMESRYINSFLLRRENDFVMRFLKVQEDPNLLVIATRTSEYTPYNFSTIDFSGANKDPRLILTQYRNRLFSDIFVVQRIYYQNWQPTANPDPLSEDASTVLNPVFQLETVLELQNSPIYLMRISRVVNPR